MKTAIIYLCYNDEPSKYLERMIEGVKKQDNQDNLELIIVYNPGIVDCDKVVRFIEEKIKINKEDVCNTIFLPQKKNLGYVGGNNIGIKWAIDNDFDYVFLHNADGFLDEDAIKTIIDSIEDEDEVGVAQPLVMMWPDKHLVNTIGNRFHFLGFGHCGGYKLPFDNSPVIFNNQEIGFASGAALFMRVDLLRKYGGLDKDYFIYGEDLEYSLRLRSLGYKVISVTQSVFYHEYNFSKNPEKYYLIERNRKITLFTYFRIPTLVLISPVLLIMELGVWLFALLDGWLKQKVREYCYWLHFKNWRMVWQKRRLVQSNRKVSDRILLKRAVGSIKFEDIDNPLLKYIANPLMSLYWFIIKKLLFW
jgi:GT2 family glycosyltransferase